MDTISYSKLRQNLASVLDQVNEDRAPVLVTRQSGRSAVLLSEEDYRSLEETLYLAQSPRNAQRLQESIEELRAGGGTERDLAE